MTTKKLLLLGLLLTSFSVMPFIQFAYVGESLISAGLGRLFASRAATAATGEVFTKLLQSTVASSKAIIQKNLSNIPLKSALRTAGGGTFLAVLGQSGISIYDYFTNEKVTFDGNLTDENLKVSRPSENSLGELKEWNGTFIDLVTAEGTSVRGYPQPPLLRKETSSRYAIYSATTDPRLQEWIQSSSPTIFSNSYVQQPDGKAVKMDLYRYQRTFKTGETVDVPKLSDKVTGSVADVVPKSKLEETVPIDVLTDMVNSITRNIEADATYEGVSFPDVWTRDQVAAAFPGVRWVDLVRPIEKDIPSIPVISTPNADVVPDWGTSPDNGDLSDPEAPPISLIIQPFKIMQTDINNRLGFNIPAGECPVFTVNFFGKIKSDNTFCEFMNKYAGVLRAIFLAMSSILAVRIFLTA